MHPERPALEALFTAIKADHPDFGQKRLIVAARTREPTWAISEKRALKLIKSLAASAPPGKGSSGEGIAGAGASSGSGGTAAPAAAAAAAHAAPVVTLDSHGRVPGFDAVNYDFRAFKGALTPEPPVLMALIEVRGLVTLLQRAAGVPSQLRVCAYVEMKQ